MEKDDCAKQNLTRCEALRFKLFNINFVMIEGKESVEN